MESKKYFDEKNFALMQSYTNPLRERINYFGTKSEELYINNQNNISDIIIQLNGLLLAAIGIITSLNISIIKDIESLIGSIVLIMGSIFYELYIKTLISKKFRKYYGFYGDIFENELTSHHKNIKEGISKNILVVKKLNKQSKIEKINDLQALNTESIILDQNKGYEKRKIEINKLHLVLEKIHADINSKRKVGGLFIGASIILFILLIRN